MGPESNEGQQAYKAQTVLIKGKRNQVPFEEHNEKKQE